MFATNRKIDKNYISMTTRFGKDNFSEQGLLTGKKGGFRWTHHKFVKTNYLDQ